MKIIKETNLINNYRCYLLKSNPTIMKVVLKNYQKFFLIEI